MPFFSFLPTPAPAGPTIFNGTDGDDDLFLFEGGATEVNTGAGNDFVRSFFLSDDVINTGSGNDVVIAGGGDDVINAGTGFDQVLGGAGADTFVFGDDFFAGSDNFTLIAEIAEEDQIDLSAANISFADLDTNGDGVLNNSDDSIREDGNSVFLAFGDNTIELLNNNGVPELTEDLFAFG